MKSILVILFLPTILFGQRTFEHIVIGTNNRHIRADQTYVHLPNQSVVRAKMVQYGPSLMRFVWTNKRFKFYVDYVDAQLCFVQESKRTENIVCAWIITDYKITYCK